MTTKIKDTLWYVYVLECEDGTLYTGVTTDLARRFEEHQSGRGAKYTRSRGAKRIVYTEPCESRSQAFKREAEIKRLSRAQKIRLIKSPQHASRGV
jgi:putative endonuclease